MTRAGEPARSAFLVQRGAVEVLAPTDPPSVVHCVGPGGVVGELALLLERPTRLTTTRAASDDVLLVDRAADGRPLGIEITDPSQFDPHRFFELLKRLGHSDVDRADFLPLMAA